MLRFACEWCQRLKEADEAWILGFAAENRGVTASRREVTVPNEWDRERAVHPFAVHFCSIEHKDNYMSALFDSSPVDAVKGRKVVPVIESEEVEVRRTVPGKRVVTSQKRKTPASRRRAS